MRDVRRGRDVKPRPAPNTDPKQPEVQPEAQPVEEAPYDRDFLRQLIDEWDIPSKREKSNP